MRVSVLATRTAIVAAVGALIVGGAFALAGVTAATPAAQYPAIKGALSPAGTADPLHAAAAPATSAAARTAPASDLKGARQRPHPANTANAARRAGSGDNSPLDDRGAGALLHNFNGVGSLDSEVTNFGAKFEPPDQGLCAGNGFVVEPVNSAYSVFRPDGSLVAGPFNVNDLFGEGGLEFTSDPRCHFDKATNTWFAIILFIGTDSQGNFTNVGRTDIAVNTSGDPTTPWTEYRLDAIDDGSNGTPSHPGCPCFGDQPRLGIDSQNLYISTDEFSILGPEFNGTQIYAVSKADLIHHAAAPHFVHFDNLSIGGTLVDGVQPAVTYGDSNAEYFLGAVDPDRVGSNQLSVWALTDRDAVSRGDFPTLSNMVITSEAYNVPPPAVQKGSTLTLDSGDDRMQEVEFIDGSLWGALGTALNVKGDTDARAAAAWFEIHPRLHGKTLGGADLRAQGYVASLGNYLLYPSIVANGDGVAAMVVTISGANLFPSAAYAVLRDEHHGFGNIHVAAAGTGPYSGPRATRWGDYSWAALDPSGDGFWFATEYIPPKASQTTTGRRNWGTRVFEVSSGDD